MNFLRDFNYGCGTQLSYGTTLREYDIVEDDKVMDVLRVSMPSVLLMGDSFLQFELPRVFFLNKFANNGENEYSMHFQ